MATKTRKEQQAGRAKREARRAQLGAQERERREKKLAADRAYQAARRAAKKEAKLAGLSEAESALAGAHHHEPEPTPEQCHDCEAYHLPTDTRTWGSLLVDLDPGNAEVGPDPDITTVALCPDCGAKRTAETAQRLAARAAEAKAKRTAAQDKAHVADALNSRLWSRLLTLCRRTGYEGKWQVPPLVAWAQAHGLEAEVPPSRRNGAQVAFENNLRATGRW